jgi:hypothetical protein
MNSADFALYTLWRASKQYRESVEHLNALHDRGSPDGIWNFAVETAHAEVTDAYTHFVAALDEIEALHPRDDEEF